VFRELAGCQRFGNKGGKNKEEEPRKGLLSLKKKWIISCGSRTIRGGLDCPMTTGTPGQPRKRASEGQRSDTNCSQTNEGKPSALIGRTQKRQKGA